MTGERPDTKTTPGRSPLPQKVVNLLQQKTFCCNCLNAETYELRYCVLCAQAGVVGAVAVALHVSCTLQHVKGNAETEGKNALEVRVAE